MDSRSRVSHRRNKDRAADLKTWEAETEAINRHVHALSERVKALAKTKTLDELIDIGVNHAIEKAADEAPQEPISRERIDAIMQRAKEDGVNEPPP